MLTSSGGRSVLTEGRGGKICQNLADVLCERSHTRYLHLTRCISRIRRRARAQNRALVRATRYLCSRDALGLKADRPSAARDDRVSCIQASSIK